MNDPVSCSSMLCQRSYQTGSRLRLRKRESRKILEEELSESIPQYLLALTASEPKINVVAYVVSQLQRYSLLASSVDVKGIAYEEIVRK